jgi:hypothetical protein
MTEKLKKIVWWSYEIYTSAKLEYVNVHWGFNIYQQYH